MGEGGGACACAALRGSGGPPRPVCSPRGWGCPPPPQLLAAPCSLLCFKCARPPVLSQFCEEFKEKCPICVPCGLKLAEKTQTAIVRHFGLQILEHVVK